MAAQLTGVRERRELWPTCALRRSWVWVGLVAEGQGASQAAAAEALLMQPGRQACLPLLHPAHRQQSQLLQQGRERVLPLPQRPPPHPLTCLQAA